MAVTALVLRRQSDAGTLHGGLVPVWRFDPLLVRHFGLGIFRGDISGAFAAWVGFGRLTLWLVSGHAMCTSGTPP